MVEGLRGGRQVNIIFKALRNMVRNSSTKYRQLLSVERLSEQGASFQPLASYARSLEGGGILLIEFLPCSEALKNYIYLSAFP